MNRHLGNFIGLGFGTFISFCFIEFYGIILPASDVFPIEKPIICKNENKLSLKCLRRRKANTLKIKTIGKTPPVKLYAKKRVNDIGQLTDIDFKDLKDLNPEIHKVKVVSIGDSYVEAVQVDNEKTFHGILNKKNIYQKNKPTNRKIISTAIGTSGGQLPTYLKNLQFAKQEINAKNTYFIINVCSNDFDSSFEKTKNDNIDGFFYFSELNENIYFKPSPANNFIYRSFLYLLDRSNGLRVLFLNLKFKASYTNTKTSFNCFINNYMKTKTKCSKAEFVANVKEDTIETDPERIALSYKATDLFFKYLERYNPTLTEKKRIILILDADRLSLYNIGIKRSQFFESQREYFLKKANNHDFNVVDMEPIFKREFKKNGKRFDFTFDNHWNENGHSVVSNEIYNVIQKNELVSD